MTRGILETLGLAGPLVVALPVGLLGVEYLLGGQSLLGAGLVVAAVIVVILGQRARTPDDVPASAAEKVTKRVTNDPDDES
ncbi:MAG: hypothetical protein ABEI96_04315 [Haloarculaceae archaeon]